MKARIFFITMLLFSVSTLIAANIDPAADGHQYMWGENIGWINMEPSQGDGVTISNKTVTGYVWGENIGWINLNPTLAGVTNDGLGNLSGYAWGENIGWISFSSVNDINPVVAYGVVIDSATGLLSGYAWSENAGWIHFDHTEIASRVRTSWSIDSDSDNISDYHEINTYGTLVNDADSDNDGKDDGEELSYWGDNWNTNYDADATANNLLDNDSDNDGYLDGQEIDEGSDPSDANSVPSGDFSPSINLLLLLEE